MMLLHVLCNLYLFLQPGLPPGLGSRLFSLLSPVWGWGLTKTVPAWLLQRHFHLPKAWISENSPQGTPYFLNLSSLLSYSYNENTMLQSSYCLHRRQARQYWQIESFDPICWKESIHQDDLSLSERNCYSKKNLENYPNNNCLHILKFKLISL